MIFLVRFFCGLSALLLCAGLSGCLPSAQGDAEEEREAHYLAGKNCLSTYDYQGAIESFEKAVEVNPHSAAAHFQLGCLYEKKGPQLEPQPDEAIYHYKQFLKWRPGADNAEYVKDRINNCKQDLATSGMQLPISAGMQHEVELLGEDNKRLRAENERLRAQLASRSADPPGTPTTQPVGHDSATTGTVGHLAAPTGSPATTSTSGRTHVVQPGETPTAIARKYGVKLEDLLRANPGLDPKRMRSGKTLNIPPS